MKNNKSLAEQLEIGHLTECFNCEGIEARIETLEGIKDIQDVVDLFNYANDGEPNGTFVGITKVSIWKHGSENRTCISFKLANTTRYLSGKNIVGIHLFGDFWKQAQKMKLDIDGIIIHKDCKEIRFLVSKRRPENQFICPKCNTKTKKHRLSYCWIFECKNCEINYKRLYSEGARN